MVGKIIRDYMTGGNKKLTVPGFGTFMRKDSGDIIFVDLIRKDDGVLRELVEDYGHYSEVDAMALVDRFIFETKKGIERDGGAAIEGFGTMYLDDKGLYQFKYSPQAKPVKDNPVQERLFPKEEPRPAQSPAGAPAQRPAARPQPGRPEPRYAQRKPQPKPRKKSIKSRPDKLIIIAIVAAIIAIMIMIFGLSSTGNLPFLNN